MNLKKKLNSQVQNKHHIFYFGVPTSGVGGGINPVGTKYQVFPKKLFEGSPKSMSTCSNLFIVEKKRHPGVQNPNIFGQN